MNGLEALGDFLEKGVAGHKYTSKKPDGKGGWIYTYPEEQSRTKRPVTPQVEGSFSAVPSPPPKPDVTKEGYQQIGTYQDGEVAAHYSEKHHALQMVDVESGHALESRTNVTSLEQAKQIADKVLGNKENEKPAVDENAMPDGTLTQHTARIGMMVNGGFKVTDVNPKRTRVKIRYAEPRATVSREYTFSWDGKGFKRQGQYLKEDRAEKSMSGITDLEDFLSKSGGEGSRGGKVVGHTAGGKPIYESASSGQHHKHLNAKEHGEAEALHHKKLVEIHTAALNRIPGDQNRPTTHKDILAELTPEEKKKIAHHKEQEAQHSSHKTMYDSPGWKAKRGESDQKPARDPFAAGKKLSEGKTALEVHNPPAAAAQRAKGKIMGKSATDGITGLEDYLSKASGHKYISRKPDGKGGWNYKYASDKNSGSKFPGSEKLKPHTIEIKGKPYRASERKYGMLLLIGSDGRKLVLTPKIGRDADGVLGYTGEYDCHAPQGDRIRRIYTDMTFRRDGGKVVASGPVEKTKKSLDATTILEDYLSKAGGPYIGPRGGKWADAKHTIPWKEGGPAKPGKKPDAKPEHEPADLGKKLLGAQRHRNLLRTAVETARKRGGAENEKLASHFEGQAKETDDEIRALKIRIAVKQKPTKTEKSMSGITDLESYWQKSQGPRSADDLRKSMFGKYPSTGRSDGITKWADQFYSTSQLQVDALKLVKEAMAIDAERDAWNSRNDKLSWRERQDLGKTERDAYDKKVEEGSKRFDDREAKVSENMAALERKLVDAMIDQAEIEAAQKKVTKSLDATEILEDYLSKSEAGKPADAPTETELQKSVPPVSDTDAAVMRYLGDDPVRKSIDLSGRSDLDVARARQAAVARGQVAARDEIVAVSGPGTGNAASLLNKARNVAPGYGSPTIPLLNQHTLCKSCGTQRTAVLTTCPGCGGGHVVPLGHDRRSQFRPAKSPHNEVLTDRPKE